MHSKLLGPTVAQLTWLVVALTLSFFVDIDYIFLVNNWSNISSMITYYYIYSAATVKLILANLI